MLEEYYSYGATVTHSGKCQINGDIFLSDWLKSLLYLGSRVCTYQVLPYSTLRVTSTSTYLTLKYLKREAGIVITINNNSKCQAANMRVISHAYPYSILSLVHTLPSYTFKASIGSSDHRTWPYFPRLTGLGTSNGIYGVLLK